jgi:hypothetical protein
MKHNFLVTPSSVQQEFDIATFEAKFEELDNKDEARAAMNSRMQNYNAGEIVKALMSPDGGAEFQALKKLDSDGFSNSVYNRLHFNLSILPVEEREARLADAHILQQKGLVRPVELIRMLYKLGDYSAFQTWDRFSQYSAGVDYGSDRGYIDHTRDSIINRMVKESSVETMGLMLKSPQPGRSRDIQIAIGTWAELDSRGAFDWYEKNASTLSPENKSSVAAGFFGKAYDNNEFEVAKQWAEQISDPKMRNAALGAIDKKMKKAEIK